MRGKNIGNRGITLIALVITIVILIILAGISLGAITGHDGILNKANTAKKDTEYAQWEEKIEAAKTDAEKKNMNPTLEDVIEELKDNGVIDDESQVNKETGAITTNKPVYTIEGKLNDYLEKEVEIAGGALDTLAKDPASENTPVKDSLGNIVWVPKGFIVGNPTDNVEDGIYIIDQSQGATAGSEFVWIPVGKGIKKKDETTFDVTLGRYVFNSDGTINAELSKTEPTDQLKTSSSSSDYYTEGLKNSTTTNTHAKDIDTFITKVEATGGYYIGRYEARDGVTDSERTSSTDDTNQLVCTPSNYVYNYVTQSQAASLSQGMYSDSNFTSDLVNSYAWDTAIVFIQECSENNKYSRQTRVTSTFAPQGTNKLDTTDVICNIYDMASNCYEWTTETSSFTSFPCVGRGGGYDSGGGRCTAGRGSFSTSTSIDNYSFRPLLYL